MLVVDLFTLEEKHKNTFKFEEGLFIQIISTFVQERHHIEFCTIENPNLLDKLRSTEKYDQARYRGLQGIEGILGVHVGGRKVKRRLQTVALGDFPHPL